jgi:hypothetical protein
LQLRKRYLLFNYFKLFCYLYSWKYFAKALKKRKALMKPPHYSLTISRKIVLPERSRLPWQGVVPHAGLFKAFRLAWGNECKSRSSGLLKPSLLSHPCVIRSSHFNSIPQAGSYCITLRGITSRSEGEVTKAAWLGHRLLILG